MKTVEVEELSDAALDWAVAKCEGWDSYDVHSNGAFELENTTTGDCLWLRCFQPSTDWSLAGPIIEREGIDIRSGTRRNGTWWADIVFPASIGKLDGCGTGPTLLIAAMRCYVSSKLGDTVEIPEELL